MDIKELIYKDENPKLDFKRDYEEKKEASEYIKDIIALANGSRDKVGETAYLIFGIKEKENANNEIYGVEIDKTAQTIQKTFINNLNSYLSTPIQSLEVKEYEIESKKIIVVKIPFQGYLLLLKKDLKGTQYKKDNLLYRVGEQTEFTQNSYNCPVRKNFEEAIKNFNKQPVISPQIPQKKDPKHLTSLPPINTKFIGREADLKEIEKNLSSDNVVCVLNGIGGVGKSELSRKYFHENKHKYNKLIFVELIENQNFKDVFLSLIKNSLSLPNDTDFNTIIRVLQQYPKQNFLVLDNLQKAEDFKLIEALNVNFDILVTTRAKLDGYNILKLETFSYKDAKELFLSIYKTSENIEDVLKYLDNHPLFINLTAYSLKEEYIELEELKANIKNGKVTDIDSKDDKTVKEHLQNIFNKQFEDEKNEDLKILLQVLAIFPATEISFEILSKMLKDKKLKVKLQKLVNRGWLSKKLDSYKLHQIIKLFIQEEYPIEYENITYVLKNIGNYINSADTTLIANQLSDYIPIIDSLLALFGDKKDYYIASILDLNSYLYYSLGDYNNALKMQKKSLSIREELYVEKSEEVAKSYGALGVIYYSKGNYDKAEPLYEKALKIREELLGKKHPDTASSYNDLASLYKSKGDYDKAEPLYKKALKIWEEVLGENHPDTSSSYNNLALLYHSKGNYDEAEPLFEKALKIREELLGEIHPNTSTSYNNLALLYYSKGNYKKAEPLYEKALKIREEVLGENHPKTATSYNNLAFLYYSKGDYEKAEPLFEKALKISEKVLGENHPDTASSYDNLAGFYKDRKQCQKAKVYLEKAIASVEKLEYKHISLIDLRRDLKEVKRDIKRTNFRNKGRFCRD